MVKLLSLLLLLITAQHGAVVHELGHLTGAGATTSSAVAGVTDTTCAQCPAFAQVNTPAFSHSFHVPLLVRAALTLGAEPHYAVIDAAVPSPRSRGPPV
ncbi:MAG: hypothetical protein ABJD53_13390 [Gammaproteobacteria bacterium]